MRNFVLGDCSKHCSLQAKGIIIRSLAFPATADCPIDDKTVLDEYFSAVQSQRDALSKHSALSFPGLSTTLVGGSSVLMTCYLGVRNNRPVEF